MVRGSREGGGRGEFLGANEACGRGGFFFGPGLRRAGVELWKMGCDEDRNFFLVVTKGERCLISLDTGGEAAEKRFELTGGDGD